MAYGVTPQGFVIKPLEQIRADIVARLVASPDVGPSQDYSDSDPLGQIVGALASEIAEVWELGHAVHTAGDPEGALGVPLDQVLSLSGSARQEALASKCKGVLLTLDAAAIVPAGSIVSVENRPDITYTLDAEVTNIDDEEAQVPGDFTCTKVSPTATAAGTLTVIDTSVSGWSAVTNPNDAEVGRFAASDLEFRQRWADERARRGATTVSAIRAALLDTDAHPELVTVEKVLVLENKNDIMDSNGLPPHSVEAIIDDGETPSVDDDLIAQILWDAGVAGGIDTHGNQSGTATDSEGNEHEILFSRVTRIPIYIEITVETTDAFPNTGDAQVAQAIVDAGSTYDVEDDVISLFLKSRALTIAGVTDVPVFEIGLTPSPSSEANISIGYRERATFATNRVEVTVT